VVISSSSTTHDPGVDMNTFASNPTAAQMMARQTIQDRVQDAEQRAQARAVRQARRAAHRQAQVPGLNPTPTRDLPWWAMRFLHPAH
jgi:hypothetical protein